MRPTRTLLLKRESLLELSDAELSRIAAADAASKFCNISDKVAACDSLLRPCITWTSCTC